MPTAEKIDGGLQLPSQRYWKLEEAALGILLERIASLDKSVKDDLFAVMLELKECRTKEEVQEIEQTINELLYPQLAGSFVEGPMPSNPAAVKRLRDWSSNIGAKIKNLREAKGLNQTQLGEAAGLPQSHISRLERGIHSPSHKTLCAIANALGVRVGEIDPGSD